ncbi:MAG: helicase associated domain-containing protein [Verrucomicrobiota bacterium]|jgi:hypothetical protein
MVALYLDYVRELKEMRFGWGKGRVNWDDMLTELHTVWSKCGHCDNENQRSRLFELHRWVDDQRRRFSRGELTADQIKELNQLGIDFPAAENAVAKQTNHRETMFARLDAYKDKFGDCDVPKDFYGIEGLASWVARQRKLRSAGKLHQDVIRRLDEIGFVWDREDYLWRKMYAVLCRHLNSAGVSGLETALKYDVELGKWVRGQQSARKMDALSPQKQSALDKVGFPWEFPKKPKESTKPSWDSFFAKLVEFHKLHGHCDMKLVLPLDEDLHKWAQEQRRARQRGTIPADQVRQLDQLGFIWDTDDLLWERMLRVLVAYKSVHADCNVPRYWQENLQLAVWVASQRKRRKTGELKPDQIKRLDQIEFAWDSN